MKTSLQTRIRSKVLDSAYGPLGRQLLVEPVYEQFLADTADVLAAELARQGMAIRTGFNVIRRAKPDLVDRALRALLPEFVAALEPFYADAQAEPSSSFRDHMLQERRGIADALLHVSDRRVETVSNRAVRTGYARLRRHARDGLITAMPRMADVIAIYAG